MHLFPLLSLPLLLLLLPLLLATQTYSSSPPCTPFMCGDQKISYPFSLYDNATNHCGVPGFLISCEYNTPILHLHNDSYKVLNINYENYTVTLVDTDVLGPICPRVQNNVSLFTDSGVNYTTSDVNLLFFFDCNFPLNGNSIGGNYSPISCLSGENGDSFVFDTETLASEPTLKASLLMYCPSVVMAPVLNYYLNQNYANLNTTFSEALKSGFQLGWKSSNNCTECTNNHGQCGYTLLADNTTYNFTCFCANGSCGKKSYAVVIGVSVAAGVFLLLAVFSFLHMRRKRRDSSRSMLLKQSHSISSLGRYVHSRDLSDIESTQITHVFPYEELEEATNGFDSNEEVGDGGFGTVYKGKLRDGRIVAIKRLYEHNFRRMEQFMNEVQILSRLRHPSLVALYGCTSRHSRELLLVYEFIPNGTVADHLHGSRAHERALTWHRRLSIAIEAADALAYLHAVDPPVVHRDVKTTNMLVDDDFHVKVADFGLSRLFPVAVTHVSTAPQGTPGYVDPEYHKCYQLTDKSDVYSFGVVLVELISSMPAVDVTRHRDEINLASMAIKKIQRCELDTFVDPSLGFSSNAANRKMITMVAELAFRCLQPDGDMRPPLKEVYEVLLEIQKEGKNLETANEAHNKEPRTEDHKGLLKNATIAPSSPDSVINNWVSRSTTPNTSGQGC